MENHSKILYDTLKTLGSKQRYEQTHGGGSFARLYAEAHENGSGESSTVDGVVTRAVFDTMSDTEKPTFLRDGGIVVDGEQT